MSAGGALLVDKPAGPTSHDVVARVRRALGRGARVGHAGTLDPFATGLLVLLWGRSTRLAPYLSGPRQALPRRRAARRPLRHGRPRRRARARGGRAHARRGQLLAELATRFEGEIEQVPPTTSAIHIDGTARARAAPRRRGGRDAVAHGAGVRVRARGATTQARGRATLTVHCSKGTYVRALVRDLGELAGCGAYCDELRREASGPLEVAHAGSLERLENNPTGGLWALSPATALDAPADARARARRAGGRPPRPLDRGARASTGATRCLADGRLVCVAEPVAGALRPKVVLEPTA